jgi:butyrate kinase
MRIFVVNPGSTSTKIAVFEDEKPVFEKTVRHSTEELQNFKSIVDQYGFRVGVIEKELASNGFSLEGFDAFVGRGGALHPIESGTYIVNEDMLEDLKTCRYDEHASNLGALIVSDLAKKVGKDAYVVDPPVVDEMDVLARYTGLKGIERITRWHALNQKAIARRCARDMGKKYEECNFVIAHLGGGISIAAHKMGRTIDVNNCLNGDGPFSPERAGGLPVVGLLDLCMSGKHTYAEMKKMLAGKGGLVSHLGTNDATKVEELIKNGDTYAKLVYEAMAYQTAKTIGEMATVLKGRIDAIILTGGIANSKMLTDWIIERVKFIAPVKIYPGEGEMEALAEGALRVLKGEEKPKVYARI